MIINMLLPAHEIIEVRTQLSRIGILKHNPNVDPVTVGYQRTY